MENLKTYQEYDKERGREPRRFFCRIISNPRKCINCMWCAIGNYCDELFDEMENYEGEGPIFECHRYPEAIDVSADHWCGEFQTRHKVQQVEEVEDERRNK